MVIGGRLNATEIYTREGFTKCVIEKKYLQAEMVRAWQGGSKEFVIFNKLHMNNSVYQCTNDMCEIVCVKRVIQGVCREDMQ